MNPQEVSLNVASLYIGDLKLEVTEQSLWNVFAPYGQILSIKVCRDSTSKNSLGYAYVNFRSPQEAERAIKAVNCTAIHDKPCRVMWCTKDPTKRKNNEANLFLKNIDRAVDPKALYEAFVVFGPILSCKLATDDNGASKGYGFINYMHEEHAREALERANGVVFLNKKIVVNKFLTKAQRIEVNGERICQFTNVFVKNFKDEWSIDDLKANFAKFGAITSCIIQKDESGKSLGFGFVNFSTHEEAQKAIDGMKEFKLPSGNAIFVDRAQKKLERAALLRSQHEKRKSEFHRRYQNLNLYVKNFDDSMTDEKLREEFSQYGPIQSAHIMRDEQGRSKGFGFVCFTTHDDAQKAQNEMNGKMYDTKPLYVAVAQTKDERRRMFEQRMFGAPYKGGMFGGVQFVYPGTPAGYPVQFHGTRMPAVPGVGRPPRHVQPVAGMGHQMYGAVRQPYGYAGAPGFGPFRPQRMISGMHQQVGGSQMKGGMQNAGGSVRQQGYPGMMPGYPPGSMMGSVGTGYPNMPHGQPQQMPPRPQNQAESVQSAPHASDSQREFISEEEKNKLGDRIYKKCSGMFGKFTSEHLGKITGVVLDHCVMNRRTNMTDDEMKDMIIKANETIGEVPLKVHQPNGTAGAATSA